MIFSTRFSVQTLVFLFLILLSDVLAITSRVKHDGVKCVDRERQALLRFKAELVDEYEMLSTWGTREADEECCEWNGIICDRRTSHVVSLSLRGPYDGNLLLKTPLRGNISSALLELVSLSYLDLSFNDFSMIQIPEFIGSLSKLQHLNLSRCDFIGSIPPQLGNLSMLRVLDLSGNEQIAGTDLDWLSGFRLLQHLDLSRVYFQNAATWLEPIRQMTQLKKLYLSSCGLQETLSNSSSFAFSTNGSNSLLVLDLSANNLTMPTFLWFLSFSSSYSYIDLNSNPLNGNIPDMLVSLTSLTYLDLSFNGLEGRIPDALGSMMSLAYLDLSGNLLDGNIPDSIANLMSVSYLDLSGNKLQGGFSRFPGNLSNLATLDLSDNNLEGDLTYMSEFLAKSTILEFLELNNNRFYGSIPPLSRFSFLKILDLSRNQLNGSFSEDVLRLPYIRLLNVAENSLTGRLPDLASCSSLSSLLLNDNKFNGTLTETVGYLSNLDSLSLQSNDLEGVVSETHLFNLSTLGVLDLSYNPKLTIRISLSWNPPFQLGTLKLANCNLGPSFPKWLQKQRRLYHVDISSSRISDTVPGWFWSNSNNSGHLNMSYNHMYGTLPRSLFGSTVLDLRSNEFNGSLPFLSSAKDYLDLSRNKFSGDLHDFCNGTYGRTVLDLSDNVLSGEISDDCFRNLVTEQYLNLGSNNFSGKIPSLNDSVCFLTSLHLRNNSFRGELPVTLAGCERLKILDLGENYFTGNVPTWIGESLSQLGILSLRANQLSGNLPSNLCFLANTQILDISMNNISGTIPRCLSNFTSMSMKPNSSEYNRFLFLQRAIPSFYDSVYIMWKGQNAEYASTLGMVKVIDLSSNSLAGEIPTEITSLEGLVALNLSRNHLVGPIPHDIGKFEFLNFLDLSENNLSGSIPISLAELSHLGVMNLSFNNLSGRIPWNNHLQTFGSSAYLGNAQLCGPPLLKPCPGDQEPQIPTSTGHSVSVDDVEQEDMFITKGFYISTAIGFIIAFWGIFGTLTFNKSCDVKFSKLLKALGNWFYVKVAVNKNHMQNR